MKIEDYKATLTGLLAEGADVGAITDGLLKDYQERLNEVEEMRTKDTTIADLTSKIAELNATNLKLIDRIKYSDPDPEPAPEPEVTLENLFD